jgi:PAS domain S-box-containing protein
MSCYGSGSCSGIVHIRAEPVRKHLIVTKRRSRGSSKLHAKRRTRSVDNNFAPAGTSSHRPKPSLSAASRPLASLVKQFDEFLFELDADGTFLGMWSSSQNLANAPHTDYLGRHVLDVLGEQVFKPFGEVFHRVIATHQSEGIEFPVDLRDGRHWFHARVLPVARRVGKAASVSLLTHDITAQKDTEEKLRKSEALLAQAERLADIGSWEVGPNFESSVWSDNLYRILGVEPRESPVQLGTVMRNIPPESVTQIRKDLENALAGKPFDHHVKYTLPDGSKRDLHVRGLPVRNAEGKVIKVVGVTLDLTERLRAEEGFRRVSDQLLTLRHEEQRRMAVSLHETVSQEMAALKMSLARVSETLAKPNAVGRKFLQSARDFAEAVIQQIRTVSYLLHPPLLDEAGLGPALRAFAAGFSERSGIKVKLTIKPGFGRLPKDTEIALFRVVQEALTNVHRHSKSASSAIRLERVDGKVRIAVTDSGIGMPLPSAATGWKPPLGIGIAGMQERVKQYGGTLEIQSEPGRGTVVSVELPETGSAETTDKSPSPSRSGKKSRKSKAAGAGR